FDFIGTRRRWYLGSALLILLCILSFAVRGFNFSIEFEGGTQFQVEAQGTSLTTDRLFEALKESGQEPAEAAQEVGSGSTRLLIVKTGELTIAEQNTARDSLATNLGVGTDKISIDSVGSDWGADVSRKAAISLVVFLIAVFLYIWLRFTRNMAISALTALLHDLVITAGIYALIGFEVTPSTVVGLLTILGFSLYDTVVVFDKIAENTRNITAGSRSTYSEAANLAVNQTLMRSVNTSIISLLPVGGLLFVGALILGVGTIKDLALILFIGLTVGMYSSLFLATPILCDLTEREPEFKALNRRVLAKRAADAKAGRTDLKKAAGPVRARVAAGPMPAPRPGARPTTRPSGRSANRPRRK
ncbi:MAG: protein translocase subunit SecF, partial [Pseudonocardiales bacterium]|nr:protein translocase subunit SecF [Pseudonocardiales bacterium]